MYNRLYRKKSCENPQTSYHSQQVCGWYNSSFEPNLFSYFKSRKSLTETHFRIPEHSIILLELRYGLLDGVALFWSKVNWRLTCEISLLCNDLRPSLTAVMAA